MECSICYTNISNDQINTLICSHYFHDSCITTWINSQINSNSTPSCPICRCNTITDIQFEDNEDGLPPLIPVAELNMPQLVSYNDRSMIIKLIVDRYTFILNELYISTDTNAIDNLMIMKYLYEQKSVPEFMEYIQEHTNFNAPTILENDQESYNLAKDNNLALVNWWITRADLFIQNTQFNERGDCLTMAGIAACHYALQY